MNPSSQQPRSITARATAPQMTCVVIYDDLESGIRGQQFAEKLAAAAGESRGRTHLWRSELLEFPQVVRELSVDAYAADYVILSLRADGTLSYAVKAWLEGWLSHAVMTAASVVALFDPEQSKPERAQAVCYYLKHVSDDAGVSFFSQAELASVSTETAGKFTTRSTPQPREPLADLIAA